MFYRVYKSAFGIVTAEEKDGYITVEGVTGSFIEKDISKIWKTTKIGMHMFTKVGRNYFVIPSFYALDLRYMLELMLASGKNLVMSRRTARKVVDALNESTWLSTTLAKKEDILDFSKYSLFYKQPLEHQDGFLRYYNEIVPKYGLTGLILAGAAGSGKTLASLILSECLRPQRVIIVSPKLALNKVWEKHLKDEFKSPPSYWISNSGTKYNGQRYAVVHYDYLEKFTEEVKKYRDSDFVVILDESHNLNEIGTLRTQLFIKLCDLIKSKHIVWASGTSIKAMGSESIPIFRTIDPRFTDKLQESFKKIYGKTATKGLDILSNRISIMSYKVEKKQLKLQEPIIENISMKTPDANNFTLDAVKAEMVRFIEERNVYYAGRRKQDNKDYADCIAYFKATLKGKQEWAEFDQYERNVRTVQTRDPRDCPEEIKATNSYEKSAIMPRLKDQDMRVMFKDVKSIIKYTALKIQGECLGRVLGKKRMECTLSLATHFDYAKYIESTEKKTVVFTSYVEVLEKAQQTISDLGYQPLVVYGKTNSELNSIVTMFETDDNINPIIATYNSLSTAVPLTVADAMIMLNAPFRDYVHQQAISRIHRIGADTQVYVYIAFLDTGAQPNMSTRTIDILRWSQSQVEAIMGIKSPFEVDDLSPSLESYLGREVTDLDYGVSMEGLDIIEVFDHVKEKEALEPVEPIKIRKVTSLLGDW
jgi:SNF2 family DNA or RNA helicase